METLSNTNDIRDLIEAFKRSFAKIAVGYDLDITMDTFRHDSYGKSFHFKVFGSELVEAPDGTKVGKLVLDAMRMHGLKKTVSANGYRLIGYKDGVKMPFIFKKDESEREYVCDYTMARKLWT